MDIQERHPDLESQVQGLGLLADPLRKPTFASKGVSPKPPHSRCPKPGQQGMALLLALLAIITILAATALVMGSVQNAKNDTDNAVDAVALEEACKAGIDIAIEQVWNEYLAGRGNTTGNLASYHVFIDNVVGNNEDLNRNGARDGTERDFNGDASFQTAPQASLITSDNPRMLASGAEISSLTLDRTDDVTGVVLTIHSTGREGQRTRTAMQTLRISGERFAGFQFAVLSNNINCILCHAEFHQSALALNSDPTQYGSFDRVKVASLESLLIRKTEADSRVAGTIYTRGSVYNKDGTLLTAAGIAASELQGYSFSSENGKITQDPSTGAMTHVSLANATTDSEGQLNQFANLYLNYPTDKTQMTDGELPLNFPAPFPDDNGDRQLNAEEFEKYVNSANGSISFELPAEEVGGSITAGVAYGVPAGSTYSGTGLPTASDPATLAQLSSEGTYDGNLILVGSDYDPIVINNKVAVDGDLVIKGKVKGKGQILVSGNVYVVGDITYADASGEFGEAEGGTENAFAVSAGGNILMGDYITIRAKNDYVATKVSSTKYNDTVNTDVWQGKFTRVDTSSATATMSSGKTTAVGYFDSGVVDAGAAQGTESTWTYTSGGKTHTVYQKPEGMCSFSTSELMLFNRVERLKSAPPGSADYNATYYIPGYTPRYYKLRDSAPIYQYRVTSSTSSDLKEHVVNYLSPGVETLSENPSDSTYIGDNAAILSLSPKSNWISEGTLRNIWFADEALRRTQINPDPNDPDRLRVPWRFDGLLYTNNCVFGVTRGNVRHKSQTYGMMIVRGGIVCSDLGMLVADSGYESEYRSDGTVEPYYCGLRLYYDKRVAAFLNVEDPSLVEFSRLAYQYE